MKERKLTPKQTQSMYQKIVGFFDIQYRPDGADAYTVVNGQTYRLVYDTDIKFTGMAYKQI